jgi:signal transduction histidine kinase
VDITARKQFDQELKNSEERLALANRKLTLLGSITRHDVLNKLTVLNGYLELALRSVDDDKVKKNLEKVKSAAATIQKQMEVTRTYQQMGTFETSWIDLQKVIVHELAGSESGQLKVEIDLPNVEVLGDQLFASCIHNLIDNVVRHGGKATTVKISGCEEATQFRVAIADDGVGIPANQKGAIFEWTYNGRAGHGLHFVGEALRSLGMSVEEIGVEGQGANFTITIPTGHYRKME